jgi:valyl-tRNA synthetase
MTEALEKFRFHDAANLVYAFLWGELADWYLELIKPRLYGDAGEASRRAARVTLATVLDDALRLLHPLMPFISESVWQRLPRLEADPQSIMIASWPEPVAAWDDAGAEMRVEELQEVIGAVRNIRAEYGVQPGARIPLRVASAPARLKEVLDGAPRALRDLARVEAVEYRGAGGEVGASAVLRSGAELFIPLSELVDLGRERARLSAELDRLERQLAATERQLANESFVSRAPAAVVEREREKVKSYAEQRDKVAATLSALEGAA